MIMLQLIHSQESQGVEKPVEIQDGYKETTNWVERGRCVGRILQPETRQRQILSAHPDTYSQQTKPNGEKNITDVKTESEVVSAGSQKAKTADNHSQRSRDQEAILGNTCSPSGVGSNPTSGVHSHASDNGGKGNFLVSCSHDTNLSS